MDGYIHDAKFSTEVDPRNDPAIAAAGQDKGGVTEPNKIRTGATGTEEALYLLGAGRPYGQC